MYIVMSISEQNYLFCSYYPPLYALIIWISSLAIIKILKHRSEFNGTSRKQISFRDFTDCMLHLLAYLFCQSGSLESRIPQTKVLKSWKSLLIGKESLITPISSIKLPRLLPRATISHATFPGASWMQSGWRRFLHYRDYVLAGRTCPSPSLSLFLPPSSSLARASERARRLSSPLLSSDSPRAFCLRHVFNGEHAVKYSRGIHKSGEYRRC